MGPAAYAAGEKTFPIGAFWPMTGPQAYYRRVMSRGSDRHRPDQWRRRGGRVQDEPDHHRLQEYRCEFDRHGVRKMISVDKIPVVLSSFTVTNLASQPDLREGQSRDDQRGAWSPSWLTSPFCTHHPAVQQTDASHNHEVIFGTAGRANSD